VKLHFERTGGLAGLKLSVSMDPDSLGPDAASKLRALLDKAGFFDLPPVLRGPSPGPDRFRYKVTIETAGMRHTVDMDEAAMPESVKPLVDWLLDQARRLRRAPDPSV